MRYGDTGRAYNSGCGSEDDIFGSSDFKKDGRNSTPVVDTTLVVGITSYFTFCSRLLTACCEIPRSRAAKDWLPPARIRASSTSA